VVTFGDFDHLSGKMAHGVVSYCPWVHHIVDSAFAGRRARDVVPHLKRDVPIVASIDELPAQTDELVLGGAPPGGSLDARHRAEVVKWIADGYRVISGYHPTADDVESSRFVRLRDASRFRAVGRGANADIAKPVVLMVGNDCATGKMTAALELSAALSCEGKRAAFVATGQTGIYISGRGVPIDAVSADFAAGAIESEVLAAAEDSTIDVVIVEGQGAIFHPAYSGVALSLLHGCAPAALVMCVDLDRPQLKYFDRPSVSVVEHVAVLEALSRHQRGATVACFIVTGQQHDPRKIADLESITGRPAFTQTPEGYRRGARFLMSGLPWM
jgi:uncharacterized NAD-dependent epimerase/dehydratase family protein